ncbi:MAG: response regulator [Lentisphaerales bacterium]|nr:response regulator [Lentisphaerales bacterium]
MSELKIFLVEDDDDHAEIVEFSLEKTGGASVIHRACEGEEALNLLDKIASAEAEKPGLIMLDINIPRISGLELLVKIKAMPTLYNVPVIAFTTSNSDRDKKEAYEKHVNSYLVKPTAFEEFGQQIASMVKYWGTYNCV